MRMFNPDGSESEMCGNGIRCFAKYLRELGFELNESIEVETGAGLLKCQFTDDDQVRVDMGRAKVETYPISGPLGEEGGPFWERPVQEFSATAISMGNPHIVIFQDDLQAIDLPRVGPRLEHDPLFHNRTNVHFSQVLDRTRIQMRTWERGAGVTLACGTGACAVAVAGFLTGRTNRLVTLDLPGGSLVVQYFDDQRVWMKGPAEVSFSGCYLKP
jgi:diaminopimelate epimerase